MNSRDRLVANGAARHRAAIRPELQAAVAAEYAERLAKAGLLGRLRLRWSMWRAINRRIEQAASESCLY